MDFVPDVAKINNDQFAKFSVMNDQGTLSEIYERTLKMSQVMESQLTDDEKKKIAHFQSLLTATTTKTDIITGDKVEVSGPSPLVQLYNDKMAAYLNAALEYNSHRIDALAGQGFGRCQRVVHGPAVADQAHVGAGPLDVGLAQRNPEARVDGNQPLLALQPNRFDEQTRVLVEDRRRK